MEPEEKSEGQEEQGALDNVVVLTRLLKCCDIQTVKTARAVSTFWHSVATPILLQRTSFVLKCDFLGRCGEAVPVNGRNFEMFRKLNIEVQSSLLDLTSYLPTFFETHQELIGELHVSCTSLLFPLLVKALRVPEYFQGLQSFSLVDCEGAVDLSRVCVDFNQNQLPERRNLRRLFYNYVAGQYIFRRRERAYHALIQAIVKSSRMLEEISIGDNCFLELEGLGKLKRLTVSVNRTMMNERLDCVLDPSYSCEKLLGMLRQVKDRLVFLSIKDESDAMSELLRLELSDSDNSFVNLQTLEVCVCLASIFKCLSPSGFPNLRVLVIKVYAEEVRKLPQVSHYFRKANYGKKLWTVREVQVGVNYERGGDSLSLEELAELKLLMCNCLFPNLSVLRVVK